ncbi:GrlR family regulatory protein [Bradyrhizobium sp. LHD-71]|uniref:GrlR family regulatory protein n=1 Tax=Bradyrhizobium sp. LHD-71 TaxID=3072141 RepID=UPI00280CFD17|nr:GrlR family regulatory protein [Bradyrhizobium sp. LHD-71]MDQ8729917.1 GrlR family regulatory protein [Bradyrhizobium sp. LHD-71]
MDNGLYFVRVEPAGGGRAENGGVLVLRDGRILGGDAFFYYVGTYSGADGRWTGEFSTRQHTRSELAKPAFGAKEVAVAFSGTYTQGTAEVEATCDHGGYRLALRRIADA